MIKGEDKKLEKEEADKSTMRPDIIICLKLAVADTSTTYWTTSLKEPIHSDFSSLNINDENL